MRTENFSRRQIMRKFLLFTLLIGLLILQAGVAGRKVVALQTASATEKLTPTHTQADFDLLRKALEEAHTGLYRYTTKGEMARVFEAGRAKLNRPMTKVEFFTVASETLAKIRCGHTGLAMDEEMRAALTNARLFPLRVMLEGKRLLVLFNDTTDDQTLRPGMEIIEINGRKVSDILERILLHLPADGDIETGKRARLQQNFGVNYWLFIDQAGDFTVKARDRAGKPISLKLAGVKDADRTKNQNPVNAELQTNLDKLNWSRENLGVRFLRDPEIAQIRIRGFGGQDYAQWMENTFKMLQEKGTRTLLIDLRNNGGGADMYGAMLVSYLTDKPFRYFDHINVKTIQPSFKEHTDWRTEREEQLRDGMTANPQGGYLVTKKLHPGVAEQPPGKYPFLGQVMVLTDGGTFSTAADFCAVTHHLKRATFIGEETGGGYYGNNSGLQAMVTLPNTKLRLRLPMYEYWNAVPGYDGKRQGTRPDHGVQTKVENLLRGVDEQLELALKLATPSKAQSKK
jgi:C-terminal processing protease CtpA/Prc